MDVKIISLSNGTDASSPYEAFTFDDFNGTNVRRGSDSVDGVSSWLGKVALALLLSSFVVIALAGNLLVIVAVLTDRNLRQSVD